MKNEIINVKHVKPMWEKIWKLYLKVITDACVKIEILEIYFEKKTKEFVAGTFRNICAVAVHCWYTKDVFAGFCQQIFKQRILQKTL